MLKIFNAAYHKSKAGALYSNFYFYSLDIGAAAGFTLEYPQDVKDKNRYRS